MILNLRGTGAIEFVLETDEGTYIVKRVVEIDKNGKKDLYGKWLSNE